MYQPEGDGPVPAMVWFHAGGWVIGSLDENEVTCRVLCRAVGAIVLSAEYRLAPEHRFPAAAADAYAALCCAGPPTTARRSGWTASGSPSPGDHKSYVDYAEGYFFGRPSMEWFFQQYPRSAADLRDPYLVPLLAEDLSNLPPALVMTAEYEILRDEGEEYAHRLLDAGVPCELVRYRGQIHGFFALLTEQLSISAVAHRRAAAALRKASLDQRGRIVVRSISCWEAPWSVRRFRRRPGSVTRWARRPASTGTRCSARCPRRSRRPARCR